MQPENNDAAMPPIRLPRVLLDAARAQAAARDETLSQVVRRALREYVARGPKQGDLEDYLAGKRGSRQGPRT